jgi:general secretion pathway protein G
LKKKVDKDPWGNPYVYAAPGEHSEYDLSSLGADGKPGGSGDDADINSWE